jgi:hypothetical protein
VTQTEPQGPRALLDVTRRALAACSDGLDTSAVQPETPLAALLFDSLMALNFIATLEALLGARDLPFELWLAEHSERVDALTIGSLIDWLGSLPQLASCAAAIPQTESRREGE